MEYRRKVKLFSTFHWLCSESTPFQQKYILPWFFVIHFQWFSDIVSVHCWTALLKPERWTTVKFSNDSICWWRQCALDHTDADQGSIFSLKCCPVLLKLLHCSTHTFLSIDQSRSESLFYLLHLLLWFARAACSSLASVALKMTCWKTATEPKWKCFWWGA